MATPLERRSKADNRSLVGGKTEPSRLTSFDWPKPVGRGRWNGCHHRESLPPTGSCPSESARLTLYAWHDQRGPLPPFRVFVCREGRGRQSDLALCASRTHP